MESTTEPTETAEKAVCDRTALERLIRMMFCTAGIGLVAAVCTWIFHDAILAHRFLDASPMSAQERIELSTELWSRPGPTAAIAVVLPLLVRRLRTLRRSTYRRVVTVSILQIAAAMWLVVGADYPWWLRVLYLLQAFAATATFVTASRRDVRALFGYGTKAHTGNRSAAWLLMLSTPVISELAFGSTPISLAWLTIAWIPVYGGGVLLIRELVVRSGRGWPSVLLLALAYEIVEDGIGLQALTSPRLYDAAGWGVRLSGVNITYWEANVLYHAIFTVAIPIVITTLAFPLDRGKPYLGAHGTVATAVLAMLGVALLRLAVPPSQDPGYHAPIPFLVGCAAAVVVLGFVALRVVPRPRHREDFHPLVPLRWLYVGSFAMSLAVLWLSFRAFGSTQPAFTRGYQVLLPMAGAAMIAMGAVAALRYCTRSTKWTDHHTLAVVGGALVGHTVAGIGIWHGSTERIALVVIAALTAVAVARGDQRLTRLSPARPPATR